MRAASVLYSVIAYAIGMAAIVYAIGFLGDFAFVPHTVNRGTVGSIPIALVVDALLLGLFAVQHSGMARPGFKKALAGIVPRAMERATYVLASGLVLGVLYLFWRPIPGMVWNVALPAGRLLLWALFWAGWATLVLSTFLIDHFELFGLAQPWATADGVVAPTFRTPALYKVVRHPIYLGLLMGFWGAPTMTLSRLLFAVGASGYIFLGIVLEERDLITAFGDRYLAYRKQVSMIIPWIPVAPDKDAAR